MFKNRGKILQGSGGIWGGISKKKIKTSQIRSKNKSMYEVSFKSDNEKGFTNRGKVRDRNQPTN